MLDLKQHNLGLNSAWKRAQDRSVPTSKWRKLVETAVLPRTRHPMMMMIAYVTYFSLRMRDTDGHISISGLKSDVTIVFLDPDFLDDAEISAIRVHLRKIYY